MTHPDETEGGDDSTNAAPYFLAAAAHHQTENPMSEPVHQSVRDYIKAKKAGDTATTDRIIAEATERFNTRTTDGSEYAELFNATMTTRLGEKA